MDTLILSTAASTPEITDTIFNGISEIANPEENTISSVQEEKIQSEPISIEAAKLAQIHECILDGDIQGANKILNEDIMKNVSLAGDEIDNEPSLFCINKYSIRDNESYDETVKLISTYKARGYDLNAKHISPVSYYGYQSSRIRISNFTLLHRCIFLNCTYFLRVLVENGLDVNALTDEKYSALNMAVFNHQPLTAKTLIDLGADTELAGAEPYYYKEMQREGLPHLPDDGYTPLIIAIHCEIEKMVKILLDNGAKLYDRRELHYSIFIQKVKIVQLILKRLSPNVSLQNDCTEGIPSLQFLASGAYISFDEDFEDILMEYTKRGYDIFSYKCGKVAPIFISMVNCLTRKNGGLEFFLGMKGCNINIMHQGNTVLSKILNQHLFRDCCNGNTPCCRYYIHNLIREFSNAQLCKFDKYVYHRDHVDVLQLLYEAGAKFPANFRDSKVCSKDRCGLLVEPHTVKAEFSEFCDRIEADAKQTKSLKSLARIAVRKLPGIRQWFDSVSLPVELKDYLTFTSLCSDMRFHAICNSQSDSSSEAEPEDAY